MLLPQWNLLLYLFVINAASVVSFRWGSHLSVCFISFLVLFLVAVGIVTALFITYYQRGAMLQEAVSNS